MRVPLRGQPTILRENALRPAFGSVRWATIGAHPENEIASPLNADPRASAAPLHRAFASFANRDFRFYFILATAAMMADNVEHVISYWVIFQKFHSPALGGFAVISHWVPHLLFAGFSGALADRVDIRRLIQAGMLMLFAVSVGWGLMFLTDTVALWKAALLLVVHGMAGVVWLPAAQLLRPTGTPVANDARDPRRYAGSEKSWPRWASLPAIRY